MNRYYIELDDKKYKAQIGLECDAENFMEAFVQLLKVVTPSQSVRTRITIKLLRVEEGKITQSTNTDEANNLK